MEREAEIELARELLSGNLAVFDRFVESLHSRLFHYSLMVCGQREDAEEVAQDTLLKVFQSLDQLREPEHVRAWVFRIARNACLMKRRKSVFAPARELSLDELMPWAQIPDGGEMPDKRALRTELRGVIEAAIQELPEMYKTVLLLRDVEELSTGEAACVLEVNEEVVKTRLHRARLAVRQKLDGYLHAGANEVAKA